MTVARLQQTLALLIVGACLAWMLAFLALGKTACALLFPALALMIFAAVMGLEFLLLRYFGSCASRPAPLRRELLAAWWNECLTAIRIFGWQQPFRHRLWPDHTPANCHGRTGVLLVHGYMCNRGLWNRWMEQLTASDTPYIAVNLQPIFGSISDYSAGIAEAAERLQTLTGRPPLLVAHSMGGLAARNFLADRAAQHKDHPPQPLTLLTLGSPHSGTWMARFARSHNAREMQADSQWLARLAQRESPQQRAAITCGYSRCDNIVFPCLNATLPGAHSIELPAVGHVAMLDCPQAIAELRRLLLQADAKG